MDVTAVCALPDNNIVSNKHLAVLDVFKELSVSFLVCLFDLSDSFKKVCKAGKAFFLCGLCTSVMWGGIFNLATEGLGKYTPKASGLFMTMVVGGGIMPFIQDWIGRSVSYVASYWLGIRHACLYLLLCPDRIKECQQRHSCFSRRRNGRRACLSNIYGLEFRV